MIATRSTLWSLFLVCALAAPAAAQQATAPLAEPITELALQTDVDEANRAVVRGVLERDDVRSVARTAGIDLDEAAAGVMALEGDQLARAAQQARVIDQQLTAQDNITLTATTIIIILLLLIILIIAA